MADCTDSKKPMDELSLVPSKDEPAKRKKVKAKRAKSAVNPGEFSGDAAPVSAGTAATEADRNGSALPSVARPSSGCSNPEQPVVTTLGKKNKSKKKDRPGTASSEKPESDVIAVSLSNKNNQNTTSTEKDGATLKGKTKETAPEGDAKAKDKPAKTKAGQSNEAAKQKPIKDKDKPDKNVAASVETKAAGLKQPGKTQGSATNEGQGNGKGQAKGSNVNNNKPRPAKLGEEEITDEMLKKLADHKMHVLKKPSPKFRNARYFCRLCDYHLDRMEDCEKHMKDNRHCRRKEISEVDAVLRLIPGPTEAQISALTSAIEEVYKANAIHPSQQTLRSNIVLRLEKILQESIPDVMLHMYGSSLTGFGLKTADINVSLGSTDKNRKLTHLLTEVHSAIKDRKETGFLHVRADFSAKVPLLFLTDEKSGLLVSMSIHCYNALCSSQLLAIYSEMDIRIRQLVVAFRYWANLCGLDRQTDGFIPPQALNIMVIYFLQNLNPQFVPFITPPAASGEDVGDFRKDEPLFLKMKAKAMKAVKQNRNKMNVGELWLSLLRFYCLEFDVGGIVVSIRSNQAIPRNTKPWNCKKLAVEDPYMLKKNITRMVNNSRIFEYWQDSIRKAYYYFGLPRDSNGESLISEQDLRVMAFGENQPVETESNASTSKAPKESKTKEKKVKEKPKKVSSDSEKNGADQGSKETVGKNSEEVAVSIAPNPLLTSKHAHSNTESKGKDTEKSDDSKSFEAVLNDSHRSKGENCDSLVRPSLLSGTGQSSTSADSGYCENGRSVKSDSVDLGSTSIIAGSTSVLASDRDERDDTPESLEAPPLYSADLTQEEGLEDARQFAKSYATDIVSKAVDSVISLTSDSGCKADLTGASCVLTDSVVIGAHNNDAAELPSPIPVATSGRVFDIDRARANSSLHSETQEKSVCPATVETEGEGTDAKHRLDKSERLAEESAQDKNGTKESKEDSCCYDFDKNYFTDGKGPTLVCAYCEKEGHLKNSCPEDVLPEVLNLPEMTKHHLKVLSATLNLVPSEVGLSDASIASRWRFLAALQDFIQGQFEDAVLTLFGSTCNGFGFAKSDLDICMTFSNRKGKIDKIHVIEMLARRLKVYPELCDVQPISTAKVPIVKFTIRHNELEGDISLYNTLAQQNTKLLHCYSQIDKRVRTLGYTIKTFAKVCDIGDASRGSLSSYAYILMMLYYLQQVQPPVIPVLQELYKGPKKPQYIIEDCDAWFMDDMSKLAEFWPERGQNMMSEAELWLGFLRFYVEEFNYKEFVVSIRQKAPLTRFEKLWNGTCIAVEDPFDLAHNLGSGLTRKMNNFIFKTFINGRMLYGSPIDHNLDIFNTYQCPSDYFFDTELLSENRPPNVRGCRRCGKIGHLVKNCPLNRRDREEDEQRQRHHQHHYHQQQQRPPPLMGPQPWPHNQPGGPKGGQGYGPQRQNHHQQQYRERDMRDRRHNDNGGNSRQHPNNSGNGGNANRNSSATGNSSYVMKPPQGHHMERTPSNQPQHHHPQQQRMGHTFYNSNQRHHHPQQQYQPSPQQQNFHHHQQQQQQQQQQYYRQQHQQQQMRHHQQEQQRQAVMAASNNRGPPGMHPPPGFNMQPMMASTPRANMNMQQQQHPPPGFGGMRQQHPNMQQHQQQHRGGGGGYRMLGSQHQGQMRPPGQVPQKSYGGSGGGNNQGMHPVVQNLFSSAQGQVMKMGPNSMSNKYQ